MKYCDQYILEFSGLVDGVHQLEYIVKGEFFREFEYDEIVASNMLVQIELNKQPDMLELKFDFSGYVVCGCDRCAEEYNQPVSGNERLIVKFGEETDEATDNVITLPPQEHQVDLSQFIYESIILLLPQRRVHPEDENGKSECNPEIIKKLEELNNHQNNLDPRWDKLKNITLKNK